MTDEENQQDEPIKEGKTLDERVLELEAVMGEVPKAMSFIKVIAQEIKKMIEQNTELTQRVGALELRLSGADNNQEERKEGTIDVVVSNEREDDYFVKALVVEKEGHFDCSLFETDDTEEPTYIEDVPETHLNLIIHRLQEKYENPKGWYWVKFVQYTREPEPYEVESVNATVGDVTVTESITDE